MNKLTITLVIIVVSIFLVQCTARKVTSPATSAPARTVVDKAPPVEKVTIEDNSTDVDLKNILTEEVSTTNTKKEYTATEMEAGKIIFSNNCGKCHVPHPPETRTVMRWEMVLPRMITLAKLDKDQAEIVTAYIMANAKQ